MVLNIQNKLQSLHFNYIEDNIYSYNELKSQIDEYTKKNKEIESKLYALILAQPNNIFTESENNGTIIEQASEMKDELLQDLSNNTTIISQLNSIKEYIDDFVWNYVTDELFEKYKKDYKSKEELVFAICSHNINNGNEEINLFFNKINPMIPGEKKMSEIITHCVYNLNNNNYNICNEIQGWKENEVKYIGYIANSTDNNVVTYVPFFSKENKYMFDTYEEAENAIFSSLSVHSADYVTFDYIKANPGMFDFENENSFVYFKKQDDKFWNNISSFIYNILKPYYKFIDKYNNKVNKDVIIEKIKTWLKNSFDNVTIYNFVTSNIIRANGAIIKSDKNEYNTYFSHYLKDICKEEIIGTINIDNDINNIKDIVTDLLENKMSTMGIFYKWIDSVFYSNIRNKVYKIKKIYL